MWIRRGVLTIATALALGSLSATPSAGRAVPAQAASRSASSKRLPGGKEWTTENLNVVTPSSYCYGDSEANCRRYGRLYTWEAARQGCQSLGDGWRLPTGDDWRQLAKQFGGMFDDSDDKGHSAFTALLTGGSSRLNAVLGGGRSENGEYRRLEAHGFYWTATDGEPGTAWYYNFGKGSQALYRQTDGDKRSAFAVRCVHE